VKRTIEGTFEIDYDTGAVKFYDRDNAVCRFWLSGLPLPIPEKAPILIIDMGPQLFEDPRAFLKPVRCSWEKP